MSVQLADISFAHSRSTVNLNKELKHLAEWAGTKVRGGAGLWHLDGDPLIEGKVQGLPFNVLFYLHRAGFGGIIMFPSISLIVDLPKPCPYKLKMRNKIGIRLNFYVENIPEDPGPITDMPQELLDEVVPLELREMFRSKKNDLEYVFTIRPDKIVITVYYAYQHEFYVYLLEQMAKMAQTLSELPDSPAEGHAL